MRAATGVLTASPVPLAPRPRHRPHVKWLRQAPAMSAHAPAAAAASAKMAITISTGTASPPSTPCVRCGCRGSMAAWARILGPSILACQFPLPGSLPPWQLRSPGSQAPCCACASCRRWKPVPRAAPWPSLPRPACSSACLRCGAGLQLHALRCRAPPTAARSGVWAGPHKRIKHGVGRRHAWGAGACPGEALATAQAAAAARPIMHAPADARAGGGAVSRASESCCALLPACWSEGGCLHALSPAGARVTRVGPLAARH